jgi:enoyl-CoA hydratase/carnithine racemase
MQQRSKAAAGAPFVLATIPRRHVVQLTLNRPASRNALSERMLAKLGGLIAEIQADRDIRAVVLAAEGPGFCAGHDLKELTAHRADADSGAAFFAATMDACSGLMLEIAASPKPFIAAVEGMATAAGCQLVAACDLAVASTTARFATPGVNIGLFCSTPMVALSRNVAPKHAMEMLLLGEPLDADAALRFGLVNRIVAPAKVRETALDLAELIASKPPATIATGKRAYAAQRHLGLAAAYDHCSRVMVENLLGPDAVEGIEAFLDKRAPDWGRH